MFCALFLLWHFTQAVPLVGVLHTLPSKTLQGKFTHHLVFSAYKVMKNRK